jgi:type II secretory pathway pseudopilin PulG
MTVIAIIGVLAGLVLGIAGYATKKADRSRAQADMETIKNALEEYRVACGRYPSTLTTQLVNYVPDVKFSDPWGRNYQYSNSGSFAYTIWSKGPDSLDSNDDVNGSAGEF